VTAYKVHHPVKTNLPTPPTQATPPATHDRPSTLAEKEEPQLFRAKVSTARREVGTNPGPMMKSIFVGTPGAFGRDVRPKLGFAILCEQRAIKMTTEIDLVSRAEFQ
jgi:hypothetical protein